MVERVVGRPDLWALAAFVALMLGGGTAIGLLTGPDAWYAGLSKASFNPPNWVFGPVWSTLYVLIAVAGWLVWSRQRTGTAMTLWWAQLVLNFLWSPAFFTLHRIDLALVVIVLLLATLWAFIAMTARRQPAAALLFLPYGLWVAFATVLNGALWMLNRP
ncbi:TspO/MBR family protein [Reyranella sp.]|uniref:TspO/MBR family protein n=1 Tax=Reyranella sp. TaxID=1929291 RepID=UPI003BAC2DCA